MTAQAGRAWVEPAEPDATSSVVLTTAAGEYPILPAFCPPLGNSGL